MLWKHQKWQRWVHWLLGLLLLISSKLAGTVGVQDFLLQPDGLLVDALKFCDCLDLSLLENFSFPCRKVPSL